MNRRDYINNNLILILQVQVSINLLRAVFILAFIPSAFRVFIWSFEAKFVLNRCIANNLKKIIEREKVVSLNWKLTEFMKRCYVKE
jgi:hypothetical protein